MDEDKIEEVEKSPIQLWNEFVRGMIKVRGLWQEHIQSLADMNQPEMEKAFPVQVLKIFSLFPKARFEIALPRLLDFVRGYGGLEELIIKVEKNNARDSSADGRSEQVAGNSD